MYFLPVPLLFTIFLFAPLSFTASNCGSFTACSISNRVLISGASAKNCTSARCTEGECCTLRFFPSFIHTKYAAFVARHLLYLHPPRMRVLIVFHSHGSSFGNSAPPNCLLPLNRPFLFSVFDSSADVQQLYVHGFWPSAHCSRVDDCMHVD